MTPEMSVGFDWLQENWPASWQEPTPCTYRYPLHDEDAGLNAIDAPVPTCWTDGENLRAEWRENCWYVWSYQPDMISSEGLLGTGSSVLFVAMSPKFL